MCKILIIPNASKLTVVQVKSLVKHVSKKMTERDFHGYGYAYLGKSGLYAERFLDVTNVKPMLPNTSIEPYMVAESDVLGTVSKPDGGLIIHSRTSTNVKTLEATHPFVKQNKAMIHNGVCTNVGEDVPYPSGNDSEMLFEHYLRGGMERVAQSVSGYYAVGIIDAAKKQTVVFKDGTASLYATRIHSIDSPVFATSPEVLNKVLGFFKETARIFKVKDNQHLTFNASGRLIESSEFKPIKQSFGALDSASLGYNSDAAKYTDVDPIPEYRNSDSDAIYDQYGRLITYEQYVKLADSEQDLCTFWDGTRQLA